MKKRLEGCEAMEVVNVSLLAGRHDLVVHHQKLPCIRGGTTPC